MQEDAATKGRILFEEKKISARVLLIVMVFSLLLLAILFTFFIHRVGYEESLAISVLWGASFSLFLLVFGVAQLAARRQPLTIYENGFDAPILTYKTLGKDSRFVPYPQIRSIHPIYVSPMGPAVFVGYTVITLDGNKYVISALEGSKRKGIEEALKSALQNRWDSLHTESPHLEPDQLKRLRKTLSRSKRDVWAEGVGLALVSLLFLVFFVMQSPGLMFVAFGIIIWMQFPLIGMVRVMTYYRALAYYEKVVKLDPTLKRLISSSEKLDVKGEDPLEVVKDYTEEDWRQLERDIHEKRHWVVVAAGFAVMLASLALSFRLDLDFIAINVLLFTGIAIMLSSLAFTPKVTKDRTLVRSLVELELEEGRRILPPWFVRVKKFGTSMPFREAPEFNDDEWMKLVRASKFRDEKRLLAFMALLSIAIVASIALPRVSGLPPQLRTLLGMLTFFTSFGLLMGYFIMNIERLGTLRSIESFEDKSGQKVIPSKYRDRISRDWKARSQDGVE
ncbi:MAG: hypothetical protein ACW99U_20860 [Candidatus Thorarchaeota archaeon]